MELLRWLAIIGLSILAAVVYGVVHDQVTARVCVEYFTIGHPPIFGTDDPTLLGLGWGVIATWWVGAFLGVPLAAFCRWGGEPRFDAGMLVRPLATMMAVCAIFALAAGLLGWALAANGAIVLIGSMARMVPPEKHVAFLAVGATHLASYAGGGIGGIVLMALVWRWRREMPEEVLSGPDERRQ
jgi:hypothetical protein